MALIRYHLHLIINSLVQEFSSAKMDSKVCLIREFLLASVKNAVRVRIVKASGVRMPMALDSKSKPNRRAETEAR